jgi:hypothetical protein
VTRSSVELNDSTLDTEDERRRVDVVVEEVDSTEAADETEDFREGHTARLTSGSLERRARAARTGAGIVIARLTVGRVNGEMFADC